MTLLGLSRDQILAHRRRVGSLDERLPAGGTSLRKAAWAGLTDSTPRAALLSAHARVEGTQPHTWEDPALVQTWGPRFSTYAVPREDLAVFTLGRHPEGEKARARAEGLAERLADLLGDGSMTHSEAGRALGVGNAIRYAATTGTVLIRWEGARQPTIRSVPAPDTDPAEARLELARRYLHVLGPGTPNGFSQWAGIRSRRSPAIFDGLAAELTSVDTPVGEAFVLSEDEESFRIGPGPAAPARFLPSGDTFFLYWDDDRELLVRDEQRRSELWTSRVWPGALLVGGEVAGIWRRRQGTLTVHLWRRLAGSEREAVETEAVTLPLPDVDEVTVRWEEP